MLACGDEIAKQLARSRTGDLGIPTDEMEIAADGFDALQAFFTEHPQFQERPLFITGVRPALGPSAAACDT